MTNSRARNKQFREFMVLILTSAIGSCVIFRYIANVPAAIIVLAIWVAALMFVYNNSVIRPYYMRRSGIQDTELHVPNEPGEINWEAFPRQPGINDWDHDGN